MNNTIWRATAAAVVLGLVSPANAHDPEPMHVGRIVHAGSYHIELVAKGTSIAAFLLGHDEKPLPSKGHQGVAILVVDGKSLRCRSQPEMSINSVEPRLSRYPTVRKGSCRSQARLALRLRPSLTNEPLGSDTHAAGS